MLGVLEIGRFRGEFLLWLARGWFWRLAHWLVQALVGWRARGTMAGSFGLGRFRGVIGECEFLTWRGKFGDWLVLAVGCCGCVFGDCA